jgi:hypothetical protein
LSPTRSAPPIHASVEVQRPCQHPRCGLGQTALRLHRRDLPVTPKIDSQVLANQQNHIFMRSRGPKGRGIHGEERVLWPARNSKAALAHPVAGLLRGVWPAPVFCAKTSHCICWSTEMVNLSGQNDISRSHQGKGIRSDHRLHYGDHSAIRLRDRRLPQPASVSKIKLIGRAGIQRHIFQIPQRELRSHCRGE